ncbi:MAG: acyl-CoA thioesterase [Myxococcota bacterium]
MSDEDQTTGLNFPPESELTMTLLMTPDRANFSGNVHGGQILKQLDEVAYACAARYSGCYVVTVSVDEVRFLKAIHVGELVTFLAAINYTGRTSMEVGIRVLSEQPRTRLRRHVMTCYFTMVAVDDNKMPTPVPVFVPQNAEQKRRYLGARLRRELRTEVQRRHADIKRANQTDAV